MVLPAISQGLAELGRHHDLGREPKGRPSWQRGKRLFEESCLACHGGDRMGTAPDVFPTQPVNLRDAAAVARLSPASVVGVVSYGVPETAMPSFSGAYSLEERWDVAFYSLALARPAEIAPQYLYPQLKGFPLDVLARLSDDELREELRLRGAVGSLGATQLDYLRAVAPFVDR